MRRMIFQGKKIDLALETTTLPDGSKLEREVVLHPGAVVILPLVDEARVCLLRNHRFSVAETLVELPAGTLEPPEAAEAAAIRELAEETGYQARSWLKLAEFFPSPGVLTERMHLFVARDLVPGPQRLQAGEQLQAEIVLWRDALAWALDGTIRDAKTLVGILLWDRLRGTGR